MMIRRSKAEWQELFADFEASGLAMQNFCDSHEIKLATFQKYFRQWEKSQNTSETKWVAIEQAQEHEPKMTQQAIEIAIGACIISVPTGFDADSLVRICNVLVAL